MNQVTRRMGTLLLGTVGLWLMGCSGSSPQGDEGPEGKLGNLALPLVTQGASGVSYRLRDATFAIHSYNYGYQYGAAGSAASAGGPGDWAGSGGGGGTAITVSSETDPDAQTISLSVPEGQYYIELLPGWHFEKTGPNGAEPVTATLLSGQTQWVWVSRQSTTFAQFQFGLGDSSIWLNGQLNIGVVLYENPSEVYGSSGAGGSFIGTAGFAGVPVSGAAGFAGSGAPSGGAPSSG